MVHRETIEGMKFSHIGVAVVNIESAVAFYEDTFGYTVVSGPVEDPLQKVHVCFLQCKAGEPVIELVAPAGNDSPIKSVLAKEIAAYHMCYEVDDIDTTLHILRGKGCSVIGRPVPATAFAGRRIVWFYTPTRQLIELVERRSRSVG